MSVDQREETNDSLKNGSFPFVSKKAALRVLVYGVVNIPFLLGELEVSDVDVLVGQRDDRLSVLVLHLLLATEEDALQNDLNDFDRLRVLLLEWDRDERFVEREVACDGASQFAV
jgi:hypothetical protein